MKYIVRGLATAMLTLVGLVVFAGTVDAAACVCTARVRGSGCLIANVEKRAFAVPGSIDTHALAREALNLGLRDRDCKTLSDAGAFLAIQRHQNIPQTINISKDTCDVASFSQSITAGAVQTRSANFQLDCAFDEKAETATQSGTSGKTFTSCAEDPGCVALKNPLGEGADRKDLRLIVGDALQRVLAILGSLTLLVFVIGGVQWLTSGGNQERVKKGTMTMVYAVIGLFVIFAAYAILNTIIKALTGT